MVKYKKLHSYEFYMNQNHIRLTHNLLQTKMKSEICQVTRGLRFLYSYEMEIRIPALVESFDLW